jgi:ribosomal protein S18 acetylase RimI-like enzyme
MQTGYLIRTMQPEEMALAIEWAAAEGWNPGLYDGPVFYATDPSGFLIGLLDGEPIACISTVAYDSTFGFLGFYIVKPAFRGRNFGLQIWSRGMEYLGDRNVGLDGVVAQIDNYRKSGFALAYRNIRYEGRTRRAADRDGQEITELDSTHLDYVVNIDREVFPAPRDAFLRRWLTLPESHAVALRNEGIPAGFGVIRRCRTGYKIGPLVATTEPAAERLLQALIGRIDPGASVFLDVPEANRPALRLAERNGMTPVSETARMYKKGEPRVRLDKIYGVTTLELG